MTCNNYDLYMSTATIILNSLEPIINNLKYIEIIPSKIIKLVKFLDSSTQEDWSHDYILHDGTSKSVNYLALFSALSFCYWGESKWFIRYKDENLGGSYSLFYALKRAIDNGIDITETDVLMNLSFDQFTLILKGDNQTIIPYLRERYEIAKEIATVLSIKFEGEFINLFKEGDYDANKINKLLITNFKCFQDEHNFEGHMIKFYKKSQEVISLVYEQFHGQGYGDIKNMHDLTISSDYKLPQILNGLGILIYKGTLLDKINNRLSLENDSREVMEIRASTIYVGELIIKYLKDEGTKMKAFELSNLLWSISQNPDFKVIPYPKIKSVFV